MQQEQISEWTENPVTESLRKLVASQIEDIEANKGLSAYCPGEPQKTQELMAALAGAVDTWETVLDLLEGDWTIFEDEEVKEDDE